MKRGGGNQTSLKHKVSRGASIFSVLPRADMGKERAISGIVQRLKETGGRNVVGKAGVDTVPLSAGVWQLAFMGWEAGWEGNEMGQEEKSAREEPFPS